MICTKGLYKNIPADVDITFPDEAATRRQLNQVFTTLTERQMDFMAGAFANKTVDAMTIVGTYSRSIVHSDEGRTVKKETVRQQNKEMEQFIKSINTVAQRSLFTEKSEEPVRSKPPQQSEAMQKFNVEVKQFLDSIKAKKL